MFTKATGLIAEAHKVNGGTVRMLALGQRLLDASGCDTGVVACYAGVHAGCLYLCRSAGRTRPAADASPLACVTLADKGQYKVGPKVPVTDENAQLVARDMVRLARAMAYDIAEYAATDATTTAPTDTTTTPDATATAEPLPAPAKRRNRKGTQLDSAIDAAE